MLVLTRRPGQCLAIGEDVEICIIEASKTRVRIGIDAPRRVAVVRSEVLEKGRKNIDGQPEKGKNSGGC